MSNEAVPPCGPRDALIAVVGEAPGSVELREGKPFAGPAGKLLRNTFDEVGWDSENIYYTNVLKYLPKYITPSGDDIVKARPELFSELASLPNLRVIVAVGNVALKALTGQTGVTSLRGTPQKLLPPLDDRLPDVIVIPTLHPAYLLRSGQKPSLVSLFKLDLALACRLASREHETIFPIIFDVIRGKDLAEALKNLETSCQYYALDIETNGKPWWDPDFRILVAGLVGLSGWIKATTRTVLGPQELEDLRFMAFTEEDLPLLLDFMKRKLIDPPSDSPRITFFFHNARFDLCALFGWGLRKGLLTEQELRKILVSLHHLSEPWLADTMVEQHLVNPLEKKSLEYLAQVKLGYPRYKLDRKQLEALSFDDVTRMCLLDALFAGQLGLLTPQRKYAEDDDSRGSLQHAAVLNELYQRLLLPALLVLTYMELMGLPLDQKLLSELRQQYNEEKTRLEEQLQEYASQYGMENFNPGSTKQMGELLFEHMGLKSFEKTPTGRPSLNKSARQALIEQYPDNEIVQLFAAYQKVKQLSGLILEPWSKISERTGGKLYPGYKLAHVKSGRLASEGPNIQQVPKELRSLVRAEPGYVFINADYSQLELRVAAWLANEDRMLEAFYRGEDLHLQTAKAVLGSDTPEARQVGKILNFSLLYGAGGGKLAHIARVQYGVNLTLDEAYTLRSRFFETYPKLRQWQTNTIKMARVSKATASILGRVRPLPEYFSMDPAEQAHADHVALNHPVQSLASDLTLQSLILLTAAGYVPCITVHDSLVVKVPEDRVDEAVRMVRNIMLKGSPYRLESLHKTVQYILQGKGAIFKEFAALPLEVDIEVKEVWT